MKKCNKTTVYGLNFDFENPYMDTDVKQTVLNTDGMYLHGDLETLNGFDLLVIDNMPTERGIYDVNVILVDGTIHNAKFYFWQVPLTDDYMRNRGLICAINDEWANSDAMPKYENNEEYL
ncbi:MAG: hypothetical protein VZS44_09845 [Bacilli bacterium]|nr:hypothetical protein [Bacilli bacterium]